MLFGLKAEGFRLHVGSQGLEAISRTLKAGQYSLEAGELGLEGEEHLLEGEQQVLKGEEISFEQPEPGLEETRHSLQRTASGMPCRRCSLRPCHPTFPQVGPHVSDPMPTHDPIKEGNGCAAPRI